MVENIFDRFELETRRDDGSYTIKTARSMIENAEERIHERFPSIMKDAAPIRNSDVYRKARFAINPNQKPSIEKDRLLQQRIMREFATNISIRIPSHPPTHGAASPPSYDKMKTQPNIHYKASSSGNKVASPQFDRLKSNPIRHMRNFTQPTPNRTLNYSNTAPSLEKYNQQAKFTSPSKQNYSNTMPQSSTSFTKMKSNSPSARNLVNKEKYLRQYIDQ